jgi:hypothetical protein
LQNDDSNRDGGDEMAGEAAVCPEDGRQSPQAAAIARGVRRLLASMGFATVTELVLASGRRADVAALSRKGEIWIVEVKSSVADFRSDGKWHEYREFCDRLLFAVDGSFPVEILPEDTGLMIADQYWAELVREAPHAALSGARRKAVTLRFARAAAWRLQTLADPRVPRSVSSR